MTQLKPYPKLSEKLTMESGSFKVGDLVEITMQGEPGAWFSGEIIGKEDHNMFKVRYDTIFKDEDGKELAVDTIKNMRNNIRPKLPQKDPVDQNFILGLDVEAHDNDGWWQGRIIDLKHEDRFLVLLVNQKEEKEFHREDLRLHRKWYANSNEWIPSFDYKCPPFF